MGGNLYLPRRKMAYLTIVYNLGRHPLKLDPYLQRLEITGAIFL